MADLSIFLDTGLTVSAQVYNGAGVQQGTDVSLTESPSGFYASVLDVSGYADGNYPVRFIDGSSSLLGSGMLHVIGGAEAIPGDKATGFATPVDVTNSQATVISEVQQSEADIIAALPDVSGLATQTSVDIIDDNVDLILADTDELQTNQGNFSTATGFSTPSDVAGAQSAIITEVQQSESDVIAAVPTSSQNAAAVRTELAAELTLIQLIGDYHDNETAYFEADNTTETTQALAVHMAVFDSGGIVGGTRLKTVQFQDSLGAPALLSESTRYVLI